MIIYFVGFFYRVSLFIKNYKSYKENNCESIPTVLLFFIWFIGFGLSELLEYKSKKEVQEFLKDNLTSYSVTLNGKMTTNTETIILELQKIKNITPHNSHSINEITIMIENKENKKMKLILGRDSDRKNEYWIYLPKYRHTSINEIGRIKTSIFD